MAKVSPFLTFSGKCAEAMELYEKAFKAKVAYKACYGEANKKDFTLTDEAQKDWIYHAQMKIGRQTIMLCDGNEETLSNGTEQRASEVCLCVEFNTEEEVKAAYEIMKEGAVIIEPMSSATYSKSFAYLEDKFGIRWWIMTAQ
ncbi:MAG: VOC family protein [Defluviitaleaceae bacterium]|nr:VOC family protein [Defluviitaleaceae bacterium]